jgi:hypothetical protein
MGAKGANSYPNLGNHPLGVESLVKHQRAVSM